MSTERTEQMKGRVALARVESRDRNARDLEKEFPDVDGPGLTRHPSRSSISDSAPLFAVTSHSHYQQSSILPELTLRSVTPNRDHSQ